MHFVPLSITYKLTIEMKSKIHNLWISISNMFFYNFDFNNLDCYFCCMRHARNMFTLQIR